MGILNYHVWIIRAQSLGLLGFRLSWPRTPVSPVHARKNYVRKLLSEAGFQKVKTFGDFQETYQERDPDFFVHVVEKTA